VITIQDVTFQYFQAKNPILQKVNLHISSGEFVGIIGATGSGKSTLCYLINGLIPHSFKGTFSGSVTVENKSTLDASVREMSQLVGYMLQEPSFQIATPQVESEIAFGMENFAVPREEMEERITSVLHSLDLTHLRYRNTSHLSEGEKQRVILASILVMDPKILVLDECSSMIDSSCKKSLAQSLQTLHRKGKTIILVEHDLDFLLPLVDRLLVIDAGQIIADDSPMNILTNSELLARIGLIPPSIIFLFQELQNAGIIVKEDIPKNYSEAEKLLRSWLE
jgi:energy-coupling factor transport system ATP-binding protein